MLKPKSSDNKEDLKDSTAILSTDNKTISFKGGTVNIASLDDGEYVLKETAAPNGFAKVESAFTFEINNGEVTLKSADTTGFTVKNGDEIVITDSISEISIYKYYDSVGNTTPDAAGKGAEMKLTFVKASDKAVQDIVGAKNIKVGTNSYGFGWLYTYKDFQKKIVSHLDDYIILTLLGTLGLLFALNVILGTLGEREVQDA